MFIADRARSLEKRIYEQLYLYYRNLIESGEVAAGTRLPSRRRLAADLKLSPGTVENALLQLVAEGYVRPVPRGGYYVSTLEGIDSAFSREGGPVRERAGGGRVASAHLGLPYSLDPNVVDLEGFPYATWVKLLRCCLSEERARLLMPAPPEGDPELRAEIVKYLRAYRGIEAALEQVVLGAGSEFLLSILVQLLGRVGEYALEEPGYGRNRGILRANGANVIYVPVDDDGFSVERLEATNAFVAVVTPSHHFPLGGVMPAGRRISLLRWAHGGEGRYIVEDDYDSEFRFSGRPIPAVAGMDAGAARVIYMNTFAKTLASSLRISYMVLPLNLAQIFRENFAFYACSVPTFEQRTLYRFMRDGYFVRHLNRMKGLYRGRRDAFVDALQTRFGKRIAISGRENGLHLLLEVDTGLSEEELVAAAEGVGVGVQGIAQFYARPENAPSATVVVGYGAYEAEMLRRIAVLLGNAWCGDNRDSEE